jgi:hypothetical protein
MSRSLNGFGSLFALPDSLQLFLERGVRRATLRPQSERPNLVKKISVDGDHQVSFCLAMRRFAQRQRGDLGGLSASLPLELIDPCKLAQPINFGQHHADRRADPLMSRLVRWNNRQRDGRTFASRKDLAGRGH